MDWTANDWMALGAMITAAAVMGGFIMWVSGRVRDALYAGAKVALVEKLEPGFQQSMAVVQRESERVDRYQRIATVVFVVGGGAAILASLIAGWKSLS